MNNQKSVKELMAEHGFALKGSCHCDGYETWKFMKDHYQVRWRKFKYQFQIMAGRRVALNWTSVIQLEEKLNKLFADVAISQ